MKIHERGNLAGGIADTYYKNNPPFIAPVMPKAGFEKLLEDYRRTHADYANGGKAQKGDWLIAKSALINGLDLIADDVDEVAQGNEAAILEGGFKPIKGFRSGKNIPPVPQVEMLDWGGEGEILTQCNMLGAEIYYGCIISETAPLPEGISLLAGKLFIPAGLNFPIQIDENKSRKKTFRNLKPGTRYYVYFFARNSAGVSQLSEPRNIMCG
jgi:hypothetical protein